MLNSSSKESQNEDNKKETEVSVPLRISQTMRSNKSKKGSTHNSFSSKKTEIEVPLRDPEYMLREPRCKLASLFLLESLKMGAKVKIIIDPHCTKNYK